MAQRGRKSGFSRKQCKQRRYNCNAFGSREGFQRVADRDAADRLRQRRQQHVGALLAVEIEQQRLDRADRGWRQRHRAIADNRQRHGADRLRGEFAAQRHRLAVLGCLVGDFLERAQHRRRQGIEQLRHPVIAAVGGIEKLHQIVGADREEIDALEQFVELEQQRRHFQHGADIDALRQQMAVLAQMRQLHFDQQPWRGRIPPPPRSSETSRAIRVRRRRCSKRAQLLRNRPGRSSPSLIARQPSAGFSSSKLRK